MIKQFLLEILDFYRYKVANDKCTQSDMKSVFELLSKEVVSEATISDIADFYGQSDNNVRNIISRKVTERPRRANLYNFGAFIKAVPKNWLLTRNKRANS